MCKLLEMPVNTLTVIKLFRKIHRQIVIHQAKALLHEKVGDKVGESLGDKAKEGAEGLKQLLE